MAQRIYTNVVALQKADETFVFCFEDDDCEAAIKTLARFAADPDINFSSSDAAVLIQQIASMNSVGHSSGISRLRRQSPFEEQEWDNR
jgi:hypothetical protein